MVSFDEGLVEHFYSARKTFAENHVCQSSTETDIGVDTLSKFIKRNFFDIGCHIPFRPGEVVTCRFWDKSFGL